MPKASINYYLSTSLCLAIVQNLINTLNGYIIL